MGIQGLLPLLKECQRGAHIQEYKGQTLGIDAYVWLHRGAYGCAEEIATGQTTVKYIKYALHKIRLLRHYGVTPYVVFDGGLLPSKKGTETDRESRRNEALAKARDLTLEGKHGLAREYYVKAVDVTPQMAYQLIKALIAEGVSYVVAPYEADAQLAYLEKLGLIHGIITEDSDLLVFGCQKVLFKLDPDGRCMEIKRDNFSLCKEFSFSGWTDKEFRQMAILSGCDYLESIQGMGLKTAHRLMRRYKTADKVIRFVRLEGQLKVPRSYEDEFKRAELTFLHQRVFCPVKKKLVHLQDLPDDVLANLSSPQAEELRFIGPFLDDETAHGIALGDLCPMSKARMVDIAPDAQVLADNPKAPVHEPRASIKDFFKPSPSSEKHIKETKKRTALSDIGTGNLFSSRESNGAPKDHIKPPSKPVKSRFFVPPTKVTPQVTPQKREILTVDDSDEEVPLQPAKPHAQRPFRSQPRPEEGNAQLARDKNLNGASLVPLSAGSLNNIALPVEQDSHDISIQPPNHAILSFEVVVGRNASTGALPSINSGQEARMIGELVLPQMPVPAPGNLGHATASDEVEMHFDTGSLPSINMSQEAKLSGEVTLPPMPAPAPGDLGQSGSMEDGKTSSEMSSPEGRGERERPRKLRRYLSPALNRQYSAAVQTGEDSNSADLLTSPASAAILSTSCSPSRGAMQFAENPESDIGYITDYSSPGASKIAGSTSEDTCHTRKQRPTRAGVIEDASDDSLWPHEAITPDISQDCGEPEVFENKTTIEDQQKSNRVQRCNAVISMRRHTTSKDDASACVKEQVDFDKRVTSVVAGWRDKFASSATKKSSKKRNPVTTSTSTLCRTSRGNAVLSPLTTAKQVAPIHNPDRSSPILSSPPKMKVVSVQAGLPPPHPEPNGISSDSKPGLPRSTARALEAFRYRPSLTPSSAFSSSQ